MKRFVASVGLAALGVSALEAVDVPDSGGGTKPWSASASLRGFYDDNFNTATKDSTTVSKQSAFGYEVTPEVGWRWASPQTQLSLDYLYGFKYYDHRPAGNSGKDDQTHTFNAALSHAFSERYKLVVGDSFAIGQEPDLLRAGNSLATFQRISGNNIRNYGSIALSAQFTRLFGIEVGYNNAYYDYSAEGPIKGIGGDPANSTASGILDRMEHTVHIDTRWILQPETIAIFGYQYRVVNYTGDEVIGATTTSPHPEGVVMSSDRDYREHYVYLGLDHTFRPDLVGSLRLGGREIEFFNDPTGNGNGWGPYVMASLTWTYAPDSRLELGLSNDINSSDLVGSGGTDPTKSSFTSSSETTVLYGRVTHRITPKLTGTLLAQFQNSTYTGGINDNRSEQDYLLGLTFAYQFTPHLSSELGYNYDDLVSHLNPSRSFDRNRVYIGATVSY